MSGWRTALRVSRREAGRAKGRAALVVGMIMLPVLFLAFVAASYDMFHLRPGEQADRVMGAGTAWVSWQWNGPVIQHRMDSVTLDWDVAGGASPATHTTADLLGALPAGSRAIRYRRTPLRVRTAAGIGDLDSVQVDAGDPLTKGMVRLLRGRVPASDGEVAANPAALARLGVPVGGRVALADGTRSYTVVGVIEFPADLVGTLVFQPGALPVGPDQGQLDADADGWLVHTPGPVTLDQVRAFNQRGMMVLSRAVMRHPPHTTTRTSPASVNRLSLGGVVAGVALLEIVLLAGPAFAVGARRRRRDLALVAANGGTPGQLRRLVLADGVLLGTVAGVVGIAVGVVAALLARPVLEDHLTHYRAGGYRVFPLALLAVAGLAVLTGVLAALVPAFIAARQDVVAALAGRRGLVRSRKRWVLTGVALCAGGVLLSGYGAVRVSSNLIVGGLAVGELGLVLCTPALVGLISRLGRLLPAAPRIALRNTARNRTAAAPAISAVMAAVAGSVAIAVYLGSSHQLDVNQYHQSVPTGYASVADVDHPENLPVEDVTRTLRATLPVRDVALMRETTCPPAQQDQYFCGIQVRIPPERACPYAPMAGPLSAAQQRAAAHDPRCADAERRLWADGAVVPATVDDGTNLATLTGAKPDDVAAASAVLRSGGVVVTDPRAVVDGHVTLVVSFQAQATSGSGTPPPDLPSRTVILPGYALTTGLSEIEPFVSPSVAANAGLAVAPRRLIAATTRVPNQAEQDRMRAAMAALGDSYHANFDASVEHRPPSSAGPMAFILALAAAAIALGAAGIATGLAAADGRGDVATLAAVGAAPWVRRVLSLSQSGVIAGLGSLLGSVAGLGAAFAVLVALNQPWAAMWPGPARYPLVVPWLNLGIALVAVPAVAMLSAGLFTRSRLPIEQRRPT